MARQALSKHYEEKVNMLEEVKDAIAPQSKPNKEKTKHIAHPTATRRKRPEY